MRIQFGDQNFEVPEQLVGNHDIEITAGDDGGATLQLKPVRLESSVGDIKATELVENPLIIGHDTETFKNLVAEGVKWGMAQRDAEKIRAFFQEAKNAPLRVMTVDMAKDGGEYNAVTVTKPETNGTAVPVLSTPVNHLAMNAAKRDFGPFVRDYYWNIHKERIVWNDDLESLCERLSDFVLKDGWDCLVVRAEGEYYWRIVNFLLPAWAALQAPDWKHSCTQWNIAPVSISNLIRSRIAGIEGLRQSKWYQDFRFVCTMPTLEMPADFAVGGSPCGRGVDMLIFHALGNPMRTDAEYVNQIRSWMVQLASRLSNPKSGKELFLVDDTGGQSLDSVVADNLVTKGGWQLWEPTAAKAEPEKPVAKFQYKKTAPIVHFDVTRQANGGLQGKARDYDKRFFIESLLGNFVQPADEKFEQCACYVVRELAHAGEFELPVMAIIHRENGRIQEITVESPLARKPKYQVSGVGWNRTTIDDASNLNFKNFKVSPSWNRTTIDDARAKQNGFNFDHLCVENIADEPVKKPTVVHFDEEHTTPGRVGFRARSYSAWFGFDGFAGESKKPVRVPPSDEMIERAAKDSLRRLAREDNLFTLPATAIVHHKDGRIYEIMVEAPEVDTWQDVKVTVDGPAVKPQDQDATERQDTTNYDHLCVENIATEPDKKPPVVHFDMIRLGEYQLRAKARGYDKSFFVSGFFCGASTMLEPSDSLVEICARRAVRELANDVNLRLPAMAVIHRENGRIQEITVEAPKVGGIRWNRIITDDPLVDNVAEENGRDYDRLKDWLHSLPSSFRPDISVSIARIQEITPLDMGKSSATPKPDVETKPQGPYGGKTKYFVRVGLNYDNQPIKAFVIERLEDYGNPGGECIVWRTRELPLTAENEKLLQKEAEQVLDSFYPKWRDPSAYWKDRKQEKLVTETTPPVYGRDVISDVLKTKLGDVFNFSHTKNLDAVWTDETIAAIKQVQYKGEPLVSAAQRIFKQFNNSNSTMAAFYRGKIARRNGKPKRSRPKNFNYMLKFFWRMGWEHEDRGLMVTELSTDLEGETTLLKAFEAGYESRNQSAEIDPYVGSVTSASWHARGWKLRDYEMKEKARTDANAEAETQRVIECVNAFLHGHEGLFFPEPAFMVHREFARNWYEEGRKLRHAKSNGADAKDALSVDKAEFEDLKANLQRVNACTTAYHCGYNGLSFPVPENMAHEATSREWYNAGHKLRSYEQSPQLPTVPANPGGKRISANDELHLRNKGWLHACDGRDGRDDKEYYWVDPATGEWFAPHAAHIIQKQRDTLTLALCNDGTLFKPISAEDEQYLRDKEWYAETIGNWQYWVDHIVAKHYPAHAALKIQRQRDRFDSTVAEYEEKLKALRELIPVEQNPNA